MEGIIFIVIIIFIALTVIGSNVEVDEDANIKSFFSGYELYAMRASLLMILLAYPQILLTIKIFTHGETLYAMDLNPLFTLFIMFLPGLILVHLCYVIAGIAQDKRRRENYKEQFHCYHTWVYFIPVFQLHLGSLFLVRLFIIGIVRIFVKDWRRDETYIFIDDSE
jgi:hypothetical protein